MFGNSLHPNSGNNFSIIGVYLGYDYRESLKQYLQPIFKQIEDFWK